MTRLYLTRHGQTKWNIENRVQGSKNSPLTSKGKEQALQLGKRLEYTNIDVVYSSPKQRALDTANLIIGKRELAIIGMDDLAEMDLGIWEGLTFDEIESMHSEQYKTFWGTPHLVKDFPGETFENFRTRVVKAVNQIIQDNEHKDILIVTHALALKFILSYFANRPLEKIFDDPFIHPTSLSIVDVNNNEYEIIQYDNTEHYDVKIG
jgi:probable phosphoglycerate mutase